MLHSTECGRICVSIRYDAHAWNFQVPPMSEYFRDHFVVVGYDCIHPFEGVDFSLYPVFKTTAFFNKQYKLEASCLPRGVGFDAMDPDSPNSSPTTASASSSYAPTRSRCPLRKRCSAVRKRLTGRRGLQPLSPFQKEPRPAPVSKCARRLHAKPRAPSAGVRALLTRAENCLTHDGFIFSRR